MGGFITQDDNMKETMSTFHSVNLKTRISFLKNDIKITSIANFFNANLDPDMQNILLPMATP